MEESGALPGRAAKGYIMFFKSLFFEPNSLQIIKESFDSPVDVTYSIESTGTSKVYSGYFVVIDKEFMILIELLNSEKAMLVNFYQKQDNQWLEKQTLNLSKEEVLSVFSTIINETQVFLKNMDFLVIQPNDSKKFTVYNQLVRKFDKKHEFNVSTDNRSIFLERKSKILDTKIFSILKFFKF